MDPERLGYRDAPLPPKNETKVQPMPFIGAAYVALFLVLVCAAGPGAGAEIVARTEIATVLVALTAIVYGFTRLHAAWRRRRNARLQLEWERWLDSADACKVGSRKWTK